MKRIGLAVAAGWVAGGMLMVGMVGWAGKATGRPKITGIAFVRAKVASFEKDTFYSDVLRLPRLSCDIAGRKCFWVNAYQHIELLEANYSNGSNLLEAVGFYTSDVKGLRKHFVSHGLRPGEIVSDSYFEIQDPEGHRLVFAGGPGGVAGSVMGGPPIAGRIIHAGWVVKDRAAMDKFYKDVLGFHLYWQGGMKEGETNWVSMQVPDGTDWIEYMLNVPENASKHLLGVMNHIALGVPSVREAANQLEKNGVKLPEPPKIGRDGKWQLNLYDPDETRVELMEFTPVEKPCCSEFLGPHPKP